MSNVFQQEQAELKAVSEDVKKFIRAIKYNPETSILGFILYNLGLKLVDQGVDIAGVDSNGYLYINYKNWKNLSTKLKYIVLLHEALHIASGDTQLSEMYYRRYIRLFPHIYDRLMLLHNIVYDAINNNIIEQSLNEKLSNYDLVSLDYLVKLVNTYEQMLNLKPTDPEEIKKMSKKELITYIEILFRKLMAKNKGKEPEHGEGGVGEEGVGEPSGGESQESKQQREREGEGAGKGEGKEKEVSKEEEKREDKGKEKEGVKDIVSESLDKTSKEYRSKDKLNKDVITKEESKDIKEKYREEPKQPVDDIVKRAKDLAKAIKHAGFGKGVANKLVELMGYDKPEINWIDLLKYTLKEAINRGRRITTWYKESRRLPYLRPHYKHLEYPQVFVMVDISGSMAEDVNKVLTEIAELLETGVKVYVIGWDDGIRWVKEMEKGETPKIVFTGGGTRLAPSILGLQAYEDLINPEDILVIITDGVLFDDYKVLEQALAYADQLFSTKIIASPRPIITPQDWIRIPITLK